jgi:hypothetical protein
MIIRRGHVAAEIADAVLRVLELSPVPTLLVN